jgi:hypothetical protein
MTNHERLDAAILNAAQAYLRTSRNGGMPKEQSDIVENAVAHMAELSMFSVAIALALKDLKLKVMPE